MILFRASARHLLRHPLRIVFGVVGVALGVAVVVGIDLANGSALRAFRLSAETVAGRATHQVVGGPDGLMEEAYRSLRVDAGIRAAAPIVEGYASVPGRPGVTLKVLGMDPFAEAPFRPFSPGAAGAPGIDMTGFLTRPGATLMTAGTAARLHLPPGASVALRAGGTSRPVTLLGMLVPADEPSRLGLDGIAVMDISSAQELLGMTGRLSRIDLIVPEGAEGAALLARTRSFLPPGAEIVRSGSRGDDLERMTRAFTLNLTALSLLALVVGTFLVYNTMTFSVLRRREVLGTLRALGATRGQVFTMILGEALILGSAGTVLGLPAGAALGKGLLSLVTRTVNDLYFVLSVTELAITPFAAGKGVALGVGATLLASLPPAFEATAAPPRVVMTRSRAETKARRAAPRAAALGGIAMLAGTAALLLPGRSLTGGFLALFTFVVGYALVTPAATVALVRLLAPAMKREFGILGKMAARGVIASLSRTGVAAAALTVAVSATVGIGIMIGSFRQTLVEWLGQSLTADVYVTSAGVARGPGKAPLPPELAERLADVPGVARVTRGRHVFLESADGLTELFAVQLPREDFSGFRFKEGDPEAAWDAFRGADAVIVSEPFAWRRLVGPGDTVRLRTRAGEHEFPVAGVYYDYGSDRGVVTLSRETYRRFWRDDTIDSLGIHLLPGTDADAAMERLRDRIGPDSPVVLLPNRALRDASVAIFDRTFVITGVLRLLAILVAFVGVLNALMAIQIERSRELAILRATGLTPGQLFGLVAAETGLVGLTAGLLSLPLGLAQAAALIFVINRRSFGWTMPFQLDPALLLHAVALALFAALLAGLYPAMRMARTPPAQALREE